MSEADRMCSMPACKQVATTLLHIEPHLYQDRFGEWLMTNGTDIPYCRRHQGGRLTHRPVAVSGDKETQ
jgi:hypothetical protein